MMSDNKQRTTLKKLARWGPSTSSSTSRSQSIPPLSPEAPFTHIPHERLQQGSIYILKIKQVSLALFEGWDDDMCCFSILRSEVEPMRWSEARQLPGDFDIYDAFDENGNPPIHLWVRYLKVNVPMNWFSMFEEAKRRQRDWVLHQHQIRNNLVQPNPNEYYYNTTEQQQQQQQHHGSHQSVTSYSNTDVSSMNLNSTYITSPSVIASTNIVDPMNESEGNEVNRGVTLTDSFLPTPPADIKEKEFSSRLDFPHDSDQFSIRSDIISSPKIKSPVVNPSRNSMKKMIFG